MKGLWPLLPIFKKPARYIGKEINLKRQNWEDSKIKFLLAYPDIYDIGMSSYGYQLLYHSLKQSGIIYCDRAFLPWKDLLFYMLERNIPLWGLESRKEAQRFDVVGIPLHYELSYTNLLWLLKLSKIPIFSHERKEADPIVVAGGPCASNPLPLAPFVDAFFIGEWDTGLKNILEDLAKIRGRGERLAALAESPHIYVPGMNRGATKRFESPSTYPDPPIVPLIDIPHNRITIEIARGCSRGCRFCHAGFIYRPMRERSVDEIVKILIESVKNSGFEEVSLLSLSATDYSQMEELMLILSKIASESMISLSLPSFRAGTLTPRIINAIKKVRKTGFTIAPEAGSQRLRNVINKQITEDEILETVEKATYAGWQTLKLYFMIGLPTETQEDIEAIGNLIGKILKETKRLKRRPKVNITVSPFVPKPHTPFQWEGQSPLKDLEEKINYLRERFKKSRAKIKNHDPHQSTVEAFLARGNVEASKVIFAAFEQGALLDQWGEEFNYEAWRKAFETFGIDPNAPSPPMDEKQPMPWEIIDFGITREFLLTERRKAFEGKITPSCTDRCSVCGICPNRSKIILSQAHHKEYQRVIPFFKRERKVRLILHLEKRKSGILIGQNDLEGVLHRCMRRAGIPLAYSQGFSPKPYISFKGAVPLGVECPAEPFEVGLWKEIDLKEVFNVNRFLPNGIRIVSVCKTPKNFKGIGKVKAWETYTLHIPKEWLKEDWKKGINSHTYIEAGQNITLFMAEKPFPLLKDILKDQRLVRCVKVVKRTTLSL